MTGNMTVELTVAQYMVRQMSAWGIDTVFGVPGDTVLPLLEELRSTGRPRFIVCRHEGSAALMASAYAKSSGKPAAVIADSGPGAVQMLNGVYDAYMDRVPLIAITGELPTRRLGTHWPQDADLDALYREATAFNHTLADSGQAPRIFTQALRQALFRARPVRVGVPLNVDDAPGELAREFRVNFASKRVGDQEIGDVGDERALNSVAPLRSFARHHR